MQDDDNSQPKLDYLDTPVWGARAIGAVVNLSEREAFHALEKRHLDADKVGARWASTPRRLLKRFNGAA